MSDTETAVGVAATNGSAKEELSLPKTTVSPEETNGVGYTDDAQDAEDVDGGEDSDEYDFEEEQQVVEGDNDEFVVGEEDYDDEADDDDGREYQPESQPDLEVEEVPAPAAAAPTNGKPSLTALLLADPSAADEEEDDYEEDDDEDDDEDDEYYIEESTPITPTSKKRPIDETFDENASPNPEEKGPKKVKS